MTIPRIRSESPAFDLHHPEVAALELAENPAERDDTDRPPTLPTSRDARRRSAHRAEDRHPEREEDR